MSGYVLVATRNRDQGMNHMTDNAPIGEASPLQLAAELTAAWLGNHGTRARAEDVPAFLRAMHATVSELRAGSRPAEPEPIQAPQEHAPAVSVRKSLADPERIVSMIDGKPYRTLKKHLTTNGLTPDQYRARYGLKPDYPMVAPSYSAARREMAHSIGLGRKRTLEPIEDEGEPVGEDLLPLERSEAVDVLAPATEPDAAPEAKPRRKLKVAIAS